MRLNRTTYDETSVVEKRQHSMLRPFTVRILIAALLCGIGGCAERGSEPTTIESMGPQASDASDGILRIATANLWGVSVLGVDWADDIDERFAAMAHRLAENGPRLDIVLIQEAWKDSARRALLAHPGVTRNFPFRVDVAEQPGGGGLVILSRFPIELAAFHRFDRQGNCMKFWEGDCLSGKGVLAARISIHGRPFWIADTHLIACYQRANEPETGCDQQDPNGEVRWQQLTEVRRFVESNVGGEPSLLAGDFNLTPTSRYFAAMTDTTGSANASRTADAVDTVENGRRWTDLGDESLSPNRLDYVWARPGDAFRWHQVESLRPIFTKPVALGEREAVPLSDHPILSTGVCLVSVHDPEDRCLPLSPP